MKAEEMRKITEQSQLESANKFWKEFKNRLFEGLKREAESRCYSLTISSRDDLGSTKEGCNWIEYKPLRDKVTYELKELGYVVSFNVAEESSFFSIHW